MCVKKKPDFENHISHVEYDIRAEVSCSKGKIINKSNYNHNSFRGATTGGEEANDEQESNEKRKAPVSMDGI